jgi:hypothetical protein
VGMLTGPLLLTAASCGGGGSGDDNPFAATGEEASETTTSTTELQPCSEDRHLVAFDIIGMLTLGDYGAITAWDQEGIYPEPRPGLPETAQAYRQRGFEVLYITTLPIETEVNGMPALDAMHAWLAEKGFPVDEGVTRVWAMDKDSTGGGTSWGNISNELLRLASEGLHIHAAYTENRDKAYGFATGGVDRENLFTLESMPVEGLRENDSPDFPIGPPTTPVVGDDFVAHSTEVASKPPICQL